MKLRSISRTLFAEYLYNMAMAIKSGDSVEGYVEYTFDLETPDNVMVLASCRIGNLEGQGGVLMIGEAE